jgi:hypothetical protein
VARLKPVSDASPFPHRAGGRAKSKGDGRGAITLDEGMVQQEDRPFASLAKKERIEEASNELSTWP